MIDVDEATFEGFVADALDGLPPEFGAQLRNVAVTVADEGESPNILGLFHGQPETTNASGSSGRWEPGPRRITIYRLPICARCDTLEEVAAQVRKTVVHEVGHYFGIGDRRLRELGW